MPSWNWTLDLQPTDADGGSSPAAVPVGDVQGASIRYGKNGDALSYSGGSMVLQLNNTDSKYTPGGGGTYSNAQFLGASCKLGVNVADSAAGAPASQLTLPGSSGDFAQATFANANVTGDVDIRAQIFTDWSSPASFGGIISKRGTGNTGEWLLQFDGSANLIFTRFNSGSALSWTSTAAPNTVFSAVDTGWVRVTHDVDDGGGQNVAKFFTSTDGVNYTQLGEAVYRSGTYGATSTSNPVTVGAARSNGNAPFNGEIFAAEVYAGIDGTQVVSFDPTRGLVGATSFTEATGETWTLNGNAALTSKAPAWTHGAPAAFTGVVADVEWTFDGSFSSVCRLTVVDALTMLGTLSFAETDSGNGLDIASGSTAAAVTAVLVAARAVSQQITQTSVLNPSTDVGATLQAVSNYTGTAGALLELVALSDGGDVFVRHGLPVAASPNDYNAVTFRALGQQTISDSVTGVTGLVALNLWDTSLTSSGDEPHEFATVDIASGTTASYSQVEYTSTGGTTQKANVGTTLINAFGARTLSRSGLLAVDDAATLGLAESFLNQYGVGLTPPLATRGITLPPIIEGNNDGYELVKFSVGDACRLNFRPQGATATVSVSGVISGIGWQITPGSATMTVSLEDGDQSVAFILDSATNGVLDQNRLA